MDGQYIALIFNIFFMVLGYWKEELWAFYMAGVGWIILMAFTLNNYAKTEMMWYYAWIYLAIALICVTAVWWFKKKNEE
jgi:hypothetical protein